MTRATVECNKTILNDGTFDEVSHYMWNSHVFGSGPGLQFTLYHGPDQDSPVILFEPSAEGNEHTRVPEVPDILPGNSFIVSVFRNGERKVLFTIKHEPILKSIEIDRTSDKIQTHNFPLPGKG